MAARNEHLLAEEVVAACRSALPPLAGAILHGSLASGDFVPGKSDVDVLAIVDEQPSETELAALTSALDRLVHEPSPPPTCALSRAGPQPLQAPTRPWRST